MEIDFVRFGEELRELGDDFSGVDAEFGFAVEGGGDVLGLDVWGEFGEVFGVDGF